MGQLVISAVGAVAGSFIPGVGPALGWAIGSALGSSMKGPTKIQGQQQPLMDLRIVGAEYGQPIPYVRGAAAVAGQMWWNTDRRATTTTTTETSGGKGGGGVETSTSSTTYDMDCLIGLTDKEIIGVARIWKNGDLVYTADSGATAGSLDASANTNLWTRLTVYTGSASQLPDATYEAAVTSALAPAYRGRAYVFIEGLKLGQSGQVPNLVFEVVDSSAGTVTEFVYNTTLGTIASGYWDRAAWSSPIGLFAVVSNVGIIYTSPDGVNWTLRDNTGISYADIAWCDSYFVCCGYDGGFTMATFISTDGINWRRPTNGIPDYPPSSGYWGRVAYNGTTVCIVGNHGPYSVSNATVTSNNGDDWYYSLSLPSESSWSGFCAITDGPAKGTFVLLKGNSTDCALSSNGVAWQLKSGVLPAVASWPSVAYGDGVLVAVRGSGTASNKAALSASSGETWSEITLPSAQQWINVKWNGSVFLATCAASAVVATSPDGLTWTERTLPGGFTNYNGIAADASRALFVITQTGGGTHSVAITALDRSVITITPPSVQTVVSDLCIRAGLTAGQIDVTGLSSITRTVDSLALSQIAPTRQALELLMSAYFFEMTLSEKLKFVPRGGASVASIPFLDLGAAMSGGEQPEPLALQQANDLEIPAQIALTYINIDDDYQSDTQYSDRLISATAGTVAAVQMAIGMTPAIAKAVADTMLLDQAASNLSTTIALLGDYCRLEPTDPVTVTDSDGSTYRLRLVKKTDSYPLLKFEAVLDDVSVLTSQGITSADYTSSTVVAAAVDTEMELMDIPILRDADNDSGFYVASKGDGTPYAGSAIFSSADDVEYTRKATVLESAVFGTCTTTLGDWTGGRMWDETNTVTVNVGDGTLASSTRAAILNSLAVNAMLIGSELIQFRTVALVSAGIYTLSGLLRGGRGTEWAMTGHAASERCVLLRTEGLRRIAVDNADLGLSRYYKGVTLGRPVSSATAEQFTDNAIGLKPFAPILLKAGRDASNNITFVWQRRTRLSVRMIGALGISVPLGEESESYELDIYSDGTYATVVRTITASSETAAYSAAQQTADGLTPGDHVYRKLYQVSATVGRGYALAA